MAEVDIFSPIHLVVLLAVALLIFGPKRLPEIGSGVGKTIRAFKASMSADDSRPELPPGRQDGLGGQGPSPEEPKTRTQE